MSAFTALNGASPKAAEGVNGAADSNRPNGQTTSVEPRPAEVSGIQREQEGRGGSTNHDRLPFPGAGAYTDVEGSHKRKRSISDSPRRERRPSPAERRDERLERDERIERAERTERTERGERIIERVEQAERTERTERAEQYGAPRPRSESRDGYGTPQKDTHRAYGDEGRDGGEHWRSQQPREERNSSYEGPYSAGPVSAQSEEQVGEMLQRATSQGDSGDYGDQSPDGDDLAIYSGQYTPEHRRDGVIQSDPKKRKRNFSNRTKTGCMTCRRRKKKCDEQKPECELGSCDFF